MGKFCSFSSSHGIINFNSGHLMKESQKIFFTTERWMGFVPCILSGIERFQLSSFKMFKLFCFLSQTEKTDNFLDKREKRKAHALRGLPFLLVGYTSTSSSDLGLTFLFSPHYTEAKKRLPEKTFLS